MKTALAAALLLTSVSLASFAFAQEAVKPTQQMDPNQSATPAPPSAEAPDARQVATDADVGDARRYYRAQCSRFQSASYCDCVTAGVAQALTPQEVRIAGRTIADRINAQGDAAAPSDGSDQAGIGANSWARIRQAESHYADACKALRS